MWGDILNRRQFLGRFFQAVVTAHNSKSVYGIYHSWRQYQTVYSDLNVRLCYRYNDTINNDLNTLMKKDTIMAIYNDSGEMIFCSAYYKNGVLINDCRCSKTNLSPGKYIVKCLSVGKGLSLGKTGPSMTITVPRINRSILRYNNYGQIRNPSVTAEFVFNVSGIFFEAESTIDSCGYYYPQDEKKAAVKLAVHPPSYSKCESVYNAAAIALGSDKRYTKELYNADLINGSGGYTPLNNTYNYKQGPVYYIHTRLYAKYMENYETINNLTEIDLDGYLGYGSAKYWNVCEANNIEYNPGKDTDIIYGGYDRGLCNNIDTDGSYEEYYWGTGHGFLNTELNIQSKINTLSQRYVGAAGYTFFYDPKVYEVKTSIKRETPQWDIDGTTYRGTLMSFLTIDTTVKGDVWMYRNQQVSTATVESVEYAYTIPETVSALYDEQLPIAKEHRDIIFNNYYGPAMKNYGTDPGDGSPWVSVQNTSRSRSYTIPIDSIFGHLPAEKSMGYVYMPPNEDDFYVEANTYGGEVRGVNWGNRITDTCELKPLLDGYTANLSDYDPDHQCNSPSMWIAAAGKTVFMRQTSLPIDMDAIPDHQIT